MRRINLKGTLSSLALLCLLIVGQIAPVKVYALEPETEKGLVWLAQHQSPQGPWGLKNKLRDTSTVMAAYDLLDVSGAGHASALDWIVNSSPDSNDYRARRIHTMQPEGISVEAELEQIGLCQNKDGGWGYACGYESNVYDTALILYELRGYTVDRYMRISDAIEYLLIKQNPDGSWSSAQDLKNDIKTTAMAAFVLNHYGDHASVDVQISNAVKWLRTKQLSGGGFGDAVATVAETYYVVSALMSCGDLDSEILQNAVNFVKNSQLADGSWAGNSYDTAMALRLLGLLEPNPSVFSSGIVLPGDNIKSNQTVPIQATITNSGGMDVSDLEVRFFSQASNQAPVQIGDTVTIPSLAVGASEVVMVDFTTQERTGSYNIIVLVDPEDIVSESNENDNRAVKPITIVPAPDLAILDNDLSLSSNSVSVGEDVTISATVRNIGNYHAQDVTVKFYKNQVVAENEIGVANIAYLQSGQQETRQIIWKADQIGTAIAIYAVANPEGVIDEATRDNNQNVKHLEVLSVDAPNLTLSHHDIVFAPEVGLQGDSVEIIATVTNEGFSSASAVDVQLYLGAPNVQGILLNETQINMLAPGQAHTVSYVWSNIQVTGEHNLFVVVDPANTVEEFNEQDNNSFSTLDILSYPDLAISGSAITFNPPAPKDGETVIMNVLVQNAGQQAATNVRIETVLDGQALGSALLDEIPAGSQSAAQFSVDTTGKPGAHEIIVQLDPQNSIAEIKEDNNQAARSFGVQDADLWLTENYFSPNGDGVKDRTQFFFRLEMSQSVVVEILDDKDQVVRTFSGGDLEATAGGSIVWDGKSDQGVVVADGSYRVVLKDSSSNELGSLFATVDNNRSTLIKALGTPYLMQNILNCNLPDFRNQWQWLPDESGIVFSIKTTDAAFPKHPSGLYTMSADGSDIVRIVPPEWTVGVDPVYDYYIGGKYSDHDFALSPDGRFVAFALEKKNRSTRRSELVQIWVADRYGDNMVLIDAYDLTLETRSPATYFYGDLHWSPDSKRLAYSVWKRSTLNNELWVAALDGNEKTRIDASEEFSNRPLSILQWSPDSRKLAYQIDRPDGSGAGSSDYKLTIHDGNGQNHSVFDIGARQLYVRETFHWLTDDSVVVELDDGGQIQIWVIDTDDPTQAAHLCDNADQYSVSISPAGGQFFYVAQYEQVTSVYLADARGEVYLLHALDRKVTGGESYDLALLPPVWAPDGSKLAFVDLLFRKVNDCPHHEPHLVVVDAQTRAKKTFAIPAATGCYTYGCSYSNGPECSTSPESNENRAVTNLLFFMENSLDVLLQNTDGYFLMNTQNGEKSDYLPIPNWPEANPAISPLSRYMTYYDQLGINELCLVDGYKTFWSMSSLLNLTADLRAVNDSSAILLKGIAADLNFSHYVLEYANENQPDTWNLVAPPSDVPVLEDTFVRWVPPDEGSFHVRLTVYDLAGNQGAVIKRVSWGAASSITNLYTDEKFISPNGDGIQDGVTLNYRVVRPVNLEFFIYDENDNLVDSFYRSHQDLGSYQLLWDGRDKTGAVVEDAEYRIAIFDQNFSVVVDTTPPEADIFLDRIEVDQEYPSWLEVVTHYSMDLFCHARDNNLKLWNLAIGEGDSPQEWSEYRTGTITLAFAAVDAEGKEIPTPTETFSDPLFLVNKKIKLTIQDYAGNTSTRVSDFSEQRIRFHSWRVPGPDGVIYGFYPSRFYPPCPCIHGFQIVDGLHDLMAAETIRAPIATWVVQTRETDGAWVDRFESGQGASGENTIHWELTGMTSDEVDRVRIKAVTDGGEVFYSNIVNVLKPGDGGDSTPGDTDLPETGCELPPMDLTVEHLPASACNSASTMAVVDLIKDDIGDKDEYLELLRERLTNDGFTNLAYYIQLNGTRQLIQVLDIATAPSFSIFIDKSAFPPGRYGLFAVFERQERSCELTGSIDIEPTLPSAEIFSPKTSDFVCPTVNRTKRYVQIIGQAEKLSGIKSYQLDYGFGPMPDSWHTIVVSQDSSPTSQLGTWEVTNLPNGVYALRLKVTDTLGNVRCFQSGGFQIFYEEVNLTATQDKILFSPGVGPVGFVYSSSNTGLTIDATVFRGDTYIRSLAAGRPMSGSEGEVQWDGRDDAGVIVTDGLYRVDITATNPCGALKTVRLEVELDNTPPVAVISHPLSGHGLGSMVEVTGTVTDKHFSAYQLDTVAPENRPVDSSGAEIRDGLLGVWNTHDLSGAWTLQLKATDRAGNENTTSVQIDFSQTAALMEELRATPRLFSPNNDGTSDQTAITYTLAENCDISLSVVDDHQNTIRQISNALASGSYTFQWDGTDDSGVVVTDGRYTVILAAALSSNPSITQTERITIYVDTAPPQIELLQPADGAHLNGDITVVGTIGDSHIAGYTLSYVKDNQTTVVDEGNQNRINHTFAGPANLLEGTYGVVIAAFDQAGNQHEARLTCVVDKTPPKIELLSPAAQSLFGSDRSTVEIQGAIEEENLDHWKIRYTDRNTPGVWVDLNVSDQLPAGPALFAWNVGSGVADGPYTLSLYAVDKAGWESEIKVDIRVDTTPPVLEIHSPTDGEVIKETLTLQGTVNDENLQEYRIELSEGRCDDAFQWQIIGSGDLPVHNGILSQIKALPPDGEHCLRITATDQIGLSTAAGRSFIVDTTPPQAPVLTGQVRDSIHAGLSWTANTETDLAGYRLYRDNRPVTAQIITAAQYQDSDLNDGIYKYTVTAVDQAGWESVPSNTIALKIDTTPPNVRIASPGEGDLVTDLVDISGTAYSRDDFKAYRIFTGAGANPSQWTLIRTSSLATAYGSLAKWNTLGLDEGPYTLRIEAEDLTGNKSEHRVVVHLDNTAPAAPVLLTAVGNGSDVDLTWQANTDSDVLGYLVYRNDRLANTDRLVIGDPALYLIGGTSHTDAGLADGTFTYHIIAMDRAGNTSSPSNALSVTLDNHAPAARIALPEDGHRFDAQLLVKAECTDGDIASIRFQYKQAEQADWQDLSEAVSARPFITYLDPAALNLTFGNYQLRAIATDQGGRTDSAPLFISVVYTDLSAPGAPKALSAQTNADDVTLVWDANTESDLAGYNLYQITGEVRQQLNQAPIEENSYALLSLDDGHYAYEVTAVDTSGNESTPSAPATATVYAPEIIQPYTPTADVSIPLIGSSPVPGTTVELLRDTGAGPMSMGTVSADTQGDFAFDAVLAPGENRFTAKATDGQGNTSRDSDVIVVVSNQAPAAPTGLQADVSDHTVHLTWNANSEPDIAGYNLYRDGVKLNAPTPVTEAAPSASTAEYGAALAVDGNTNTSWNALLSKQTPTHWWQLAFASNVLVGRVEIDWLSYGPEEQYAARAYEIQVWSGHAWITQAKISANDQSSNVHEFNPGYTSDRIRIVVTEASGTDVQMQVGLAEVRIWQENPVSATEFEDADLANGAYVYTATALDHYGFESLPSAEASAAVGDVLPPEAPQNLTAVAVDANVQLTWQPNAETDLAGYLVYTRAGDSWTCLTPAPILEAAYTQTAVANGLHTYRVTALDTSNNESTPSNESGATVGIAPPSTPAALTVTPVPEGGALEICWQPSEGNVAGYNLYRSIVSGGPFEQINAEPIIDTCYLDTGLVNGQTYFYLVAAVDTIGNESTHTAEGTAVPADSVAPGRPALLYPTLPGLPLPWPKDRVQVSGLAEPGATVRIFRQNHTAGETTALAEKMQELFENLPYVSTAAMSPDGRHLAYESDNAVWLFDLPTGDQTQLAQEGAFAPVWTPDGGTLAYSYTDENWNERISLYDPETNSATPLTDVTEVSEASPSWTRDGTLMAFHRSGSADLSGIWIKDLVTGLEQRVVEGWQASSPLLSPDGAWLAYHVYNTLYVLDMQTGSAVQLETSLYRSGNAWRAWSPDGNRLAFLSYANGPADVYIVDMPTMTRSRISATDNYVFAVDWTPDGQSLVYAERSQAAEQVRLAPAGGPGPATLLKETGRYSLRYLACTDAGHFVYLYNQTLEKLSPAGMFTLDHLLLEPGDNAIAAQAIDGAGNAGPLSDEILLLLDPRSLPDPGTGARDIFIYPAIPMAGQEAALNVLVWNYGAVEAQDVDIDIYIGRSDGTLDLVKSETIARIVAHGNELVTLAMQDLGSPGENTVYVSLDPQDAIHELSESNNFTQKTFQVAERRGVNLFAALNADAFASNSEAQIEIDLLNNGPDTEGTLEVSIMDADGVTIANLQTTHETLAFGTRQHYPLVWDTGTTQAGKYYLYAFFRDSEDLIAERSFAFDILPDMDMDIGLAADKAHYGPDENVELEVALANLGVNHTVDRLDLLLTIARAGTELHTEEITALNLLPQERRTYQFVWNCGLQPPGEYTARLQVVHNTDVIATPVKTFLIDSALTISGDITVSPKFAAPGQPINADYTIAVSGNTSVPDLPVRILIIDPDSESVVDTHAQTISMASNGQHAGQVVFATQELALKNYMVALQCNLQGQTHHLGHGGFTVKDLMPPQIQVIAPVGGTTYTGPVELQVTAVDDITGVAGVEYRIDEGQWLALPPADPGSGRYAAVWTPNQADQGEHTIAFRATDLAGNVSQVTALQIQIDLQNAFEKLTGTLTAAPDPIYQGQQLQLVYAIANPTSQAIEQFSVRCTISDPATGQVLETLERTAAIDGQTTLNGNFNTHTVQLSPQVYLATLVVEATETGESRTLAEADFELLPAVEVTRQIVDQARILVWVNDYCHHSSHSHHLDDNGFDVMSAWHDADDDTGEKERQDLYDDVGSDSRDDDKSDAPHPIGPQCKKPDSDKKRCMDLDLLERMLDQSAWQYHIVYDRSDFEAELRSPFYTDILILGDHKNLRPQILAELTERVHAGTGLISSLWMAKGSKPCGSYGKDKERLFGVTWKGHLPGYTHQVTTVQSPVTVEGTIKARGKAVRVRADEDTTPAAWIETTSKKCDHGRAPAILLNDYGQGRTVYFAFDLGLSLGQNNFDRMTQLLADSIDFVHRPLDANQLHPFQVVPMELEIRALGSAVDLRVTESFDEPLMVYDDLAQQWITQSPWIFQLDLEPDETRKIIYYYLVPDIQGTFRTGTEISLGDGSAYTPIETIENTFVVEQDSQVQIENILTMLDTIATAKKDHRNAKQARKLVESVLNRAIDSRRDILKNIEAILKAMNYLSAAKHTDFTPVRYLLDDALVIQQGMYHLFATDAWLSVSQKPAERLARGPDGPQTIACSIQKGSRKVIR